MCENIDIKFPILNPQKITRNRFYSFDYKTRLKSIRNSSSAFIKRKDVREIVFRKNNFKCVFCKSLNNLSVDHIYSVYRCVIGEYPINKLNTLENFQTLCCKCNSKKKP